MIERLGREGQQNKEKRTEKVKESLRRKAPRCQGGSRGGSRCDGGGQESKSSSEEEMVEDEEELSEGMYIHTH
jgi:hypothetical protein